jgi:hypothetical protein
MDELVIEDKKYLSSKKAAKLTGYAKDYVGQLCREGKVEARLVGRNWYVLENSIMDHRFGSVSDVKEGDQLIAPIPTAETGIDSRNSLEYKWSSPVYTTESYSFLPTEVAPPHEVPSERVPLEENIDTSPQVLNDMQSAWQEWFDKQKEAEKMLPDASEMMLPEGEEAAHIEKVEENLNIIRHNSISAEAEEPRSEYFEESTEEIQIPIRHVSDKTKKYSQIEEREEFVPISRRREESVYRPQYESLPHSKASLKTLQKAPGATKKAKGAYLLKITILSIAAVFMAVTYLAFSSKDSAEGGEGNVIVNYLTGVSTINSHK